MGIPVAEIYRGCPVHNAQSPQRIAEVVRPAINFVHETTDLDVLTAYCADHTRPPEARLLAAARIEATYLLAVEERRERPDVDLLYVRACVACCDSVRWRSPTHYCSIVDTWGPSEPGADPRPGEHRTQVEADAKAAEIGT
ncbi:MAG TPA: hypothetical protein VLX09_07955 [Stellaceae bacterium]|nr:hypothetical protein [Stellaceae bacterium]